MIAFINGHEEGEAGWNLVATSEFGRRTVCHVSSSRTLVTDNGERELKGSDPSLECRLVWGRCRTSV